MLQVIVERNNVIAKAEYLPFVNEFIKASCV